MKSEDNRNSGPYTPQRTTRGGAGDASICLRRHSSGNICSRLVSCVAFETALGKVRTTPILASALTIIRSCHSLHLP
jgi:hypothetical protein